MCHYQDDLNLQMHHFYIRNVQYKDNIDNLCLQPAQFLKRKEYSAKAIVTENLSDIIDTLLECVHDNFLQDSHSLFIGCYGRR